MIRRPVHIPGLEALRDSIRGAQDLAIDTLQNEVRGGTQEFVSGPVVFWNFLFIPVTLVAGQPRRILSVGQKPVEFVRFEALPTNGGEILIGYEALQAGSRTNAITDLLAGQGLNLELETDDYSRNQFIDAAQFFAVAVGLGPFDLLVTLGYRDQRVQQL
jgi:hypothetical protein